MRAHAHVEQHISRLKDSGLLSFPFTKIEANRNWMATVMMSADLVRWFQPVVPRRFLEQSPTQGTALGASSTRPVGWCAAHGVTSCASSPGGPVQTPSSAPTPRWRRSAERSHVSSVGTGLTTRAPTRLQGQKPPPRIDQMASVRSPTRRNGSPDRPRPRSMSDRATS